MGGGDYSRASLIKAAKLYYLADLPQDKIAELMGVSRSKVSRMLSMARSMKIVEFKISDSPMMTEELSDKLKNHFGLKDVIVVPTEGTTEQTKRQVGRAAGEYLNRVVLKERMYLGISWSMTVDAVIGQFSPLREHSDVTVVQLSGGTRSPEFKLDSRDLTQALATKMGAACSLLHTPLYVSSGVVRGLLLQEPEIASHFKLFEGLDAALVGLGSSRPDKSLSYLAGYMSLEESEKLIQEGFCTDICGNRIFKDGSIRPNVFTEQVIAIPPEVLRQTPMVVAVAIGEDKAEAIIAAARGGFIKTLITDEVAALLVVGMEGLR